MEHVDQVAVKQSGSLAWRVIHEPDVVREELLAYLPTATPEEVAATRQQMVDLGIALKSRGNAEVLRLARLTEWEMARRWPANASGVARTDDRPALHASKAASDVQWQRVYAVGRAPLDLLLDETEPSALTQSAIIKRVAVRDIVDVTPPNATVDTDLRFGVVYADPPWNYANSPDRGNPENHYPVMDLADICALDAKAADNCVLYLWATAPLLVEATQVMTAWGFTYKTCAVWDKEKIGVGYWFRGQHELLLVGVRGKVSPPPQGLRVSSVYREARTAHSRKPEIVRTHIGNWFPDVPKLEMFARRPAPGWHVWGNQVDSTLSGLPVTPWSPTENQPQLFDEVAP